MFDPTSQVTIGGALLVVIWMLLKFKPWRNSKNNSQGKVEYRATTSGEQAPGYWTEEIRRIMVESINESMSKRNEDIRRIVREEIQNALGKQ